jgi:hypothetical protein
MDVRSCLGLAALLLLTPVAPADGRPPSIAQYGIALQSRSFTPPAGVSPQSVLSGAEGERIHVLMQFESIPDPAERLELENAGIRLLNYIPHNAWLASVPTDLSPGIDALRPIRWMGKILPEDKISRRIRERGFGKWAITPDGKVVVTLKYFADVEAREVRAKLQRLGGSILEEIEALSSVSLVISEERIPELAAEDAIRWIDSAAPSPRPESDRVRAHVQAGLAQDLGLSGVGVTVGIFENRHAKTNHVDFSGRIFQGDADPTDTLDDHASMVAGIIGGDGSGCLNPPHGGEFSWNAAGWCYEGYCEYTWCKDHCDSASQWKGMAPAVEMYTYDYATGTAAGAPTDNHLNFLGDLQTAVATHQIDIANNSWGHSGCVASGEPYDWGEYAELCLDLDRVVRGDFGRPVSLVFSAGNERNGYGGVLGDENKTCIDDDSPPFLNYRSMNHPKAAKNIITVGAVDSLDNKMSNYGSWGPVSDGRLKPDLVASGHHAGTQFGQGGISMLDNPFGNLCGDLNHQSYRTTGRWTWPHYYAFFNQTSCAAATTSGSIALLLEDFRAQYPTRADPLPSTVKALLIHTAQDLDDGTDWYNPGPDYASGYGLLQIQDAIDEMRLESFAEDQVDHQQTRIYGLIVPTQTMSAKVTLVWDDAPGTENADPTFPALRNDLDLRVIDPDGGLHFPATLDPDNPTAPAVYSQPNRLNNVEQVLITGDINLRAGTWKIIVSGHDVPEGPQSFSLVARGLRRSVLYVSTTGNDDNTGARPNDPLRTIDKALELAIDEDEIRVAQGHYHESTLLNQPIDDLKVLGGWTADFGSRSADRSLTIVDGGASGTPFTIYGDSEDIDLSLEGLTISNGKPQYVDQLGGGIAAHSYFGGTVTVTVTNSAIVDNNADDGGGMYLFADSSGNVSATVDDCEIARNQAVLSGGGITVRAQGNGTVTATVRNSVVTDNTAADYGGGLRIVAAGGPTHVDLIGNTISTNDATEGGGAYFYNGGWLTATVSNNTFSGNTAEKGGAVYINGLSPSIDGSVFDDNSAQLGGAVYNLDADPTIVDSVFTDNTAQLGGGGIYNEQFASPTIHRSVFARNTADYGAGMANLYYSSPTVTSSIFQENHAISPAYGHGGGGMFIDFYSEPTLINCSFVSNVAEGAGGAVFISSYTTTVVNSIFWANAATGWGDEFSLQNGCTLSISYSDVLNGQNPSAIHAEGGTTLDWGAGNIDADPLFASPTGGDLHLRFGSPCVNAGNNGAPGLPATDVEGEPRVANGTVDIGADELFDTDADGLPNYFEATTCTDPSDNDTDADCLQDGVEDANLNGVVDAAETDPCDADTDDDGLLDGNCGSEDLNGNGVVDFGETDPRNADSDDDGILDGTESGLTEPETPDTDVTTGFFVADGDPTTTTDPTSPDSDGDGIDDGDEDVNHDGSFDPEWGELDPNATDELTDVDDDGIPDRDDNCPNTVNDLQLDADLDGYGDACDCVPGDPMSFPGATELCDNADNDCDLLIDPSCLAACDSPETAGNDVAVSLDAAGSYVAALSWTGSQYGVAWHDDRDENWEIYFARLDAAGVRIGPEVRVTDNLGLSAYASLAWSGTEFGLAWRDDRDGNHEIYFARLDAAGSLIGEARRISHADELSGWPSLVWNGREYGLAWHDETDGGREIYFTRLRPNGDKLMPDLRVTVDSGMSSNPSLVWSGEEYGVAWHDDRDGNLEIYFARIDAAGEKIGSDERVTVWSGESSQVELATSGTTYGLVWHDDRDGAWEVYFARLYASGSKIGSDLRLTYDAAISGWPDVVWADGEFGVFWHDNSEGPWEIHHAVIDPAGVLIGSELRVTDQGAGSYQPASVWAGDAYAVAWHDDRAGDFEIQFNEIRCCTDADSDTYSVCENDCDDGDVAVFPGASEVCDYKDNNCDGTTDEGFPTPSATAGAVIAGDKTTISWDPDPVADRYDVVKGDLMILRGSGGEFSTSLTDCLESDSPDATATDGSAPAVGDGYFYLVRTQRDCRLGTFDTERASQNGERDVEIGSSPHSCD